MANRQFFGIDPDAPIDEQAKAIAAATCEASGCKDDPNIVDIGINIAGLSREEAIDKMSQALIEVLIQHFGDDWPNHIPVIKM